MSEIRERILPLHAPINNETVGSHFKEYKNRYGFFDYFEIGQSIRGRPIYACRIGMATAPISVVYVGTHHGMEWITTATLLRFINEYCEAYEKKGTMYGISIPVIYRERAIYIVPMLNPDGVQIQQSGASPDSPLYCRLLKMNDGDDFTLWQANERGVDLNHNYNAGFSEYKRVEAELGITAGRTKYSGQYPESEPEVSALSGMIRTLSPEMILTLHTQGEEIYYTSGGNVPPNGKRIAEVIGELTGYELSVPTGTASYGGLTDWFIGEFNKPSFTIECGKGKNPLPWEDFIGIYSKLRRALFIAPTLLKSH